MQHLEMVISHFHLFPGSFLEIFRVIQDGFKAKNRRIFRRFLIDNEFSVIICKTIKDYDNRSDKIKYVPKDWTTSPLDLIGSSDNLDSVSLRGDLLRIQIHFDKVVFIPRNLPFVSKKSR